MYQITDIQTTDLTTVSEFNSFRDSLSIHAESGASNSTLIVRVVTEIETSISKRASYTVKNGINGNEAQIK